MNQVNIGIVIEKLLQNGMGKIRFYSGGDAPDLWFDFMEETVNRTVIALKAIEIGTDLSRTQIYFAEFKNNIKNAKTNAEAFEYAVEYAIMGFNYDEWLMCRERTRSYSHVSIELFM